MLSGHFDLVEDGKAAVGDSATTSTTNVVTGLKPFARFAELVEYLLDLLVRTLGSASRSPLDYSFCIGHHPTQQVGRLGGWCNACDGVLFRRLLSWFWL
jgi:hypothetical protein